MNRAVAYVRVSTKRQEREGLSLDEQKTTLALEAERCGLQLDTIVSETRSGTKLENRPELLTVLEDLDAGRYGVLMVTHMDRIARSQLEFLQIIERSHKHGWALRMMYPNVDTRDPFGKAMAAMAGIFAELFAELNRQKTREGLAHARARGTFRPGEHCRYQDRAVIARIMRWNGRGLSAPQIAARLADEAVAPPIGDVWHPKTINRIIQREKANIIQRERANHA